MLIRRFAVGIAVFGLLIPAVAASADNPARGPREKVEICHYPGGNPSARHTITVGEPAWEAHHAHGDTLGRCPSEPQGQNGPGHGNRIPVADAGADRCVTFGSPVQLDGRGSYDRDGDDLDYLWTLLTRPSGSTLDSSDLSSRTVTRPVFTPDRLGTYGFTLEVDDDEGGVDSDDVLIHVRMDVSLSSATYEVDEGQTITATILLNEDTPQDLQVLVSVDDGSVVQVLGAPGGFVTIHKGDDRASIQLFGVVDPGLGNESTTLRVSVGGAGCSDLATATVTVDDDVSSATDVRTVQVALGFSVI